MVATPTVGPPVRRFPFFLIVLFSCKGEVRHCTVSEDCTPYVWTDSRGSATTGSPTGTVLSQYLPDASFVFVNNVQSQFQPPSRVVAGNRFLMFGATGFAGEVDAGVVYRSVGGIIAARYPPSGQLGGAAGLVITENHTAIALFNDGTSATLVTVTDAGTVATQSRPASYRTSPLLGRGGLLYLLGNSDIRVMPLDGGSSWTIPVAGSSGGLVTSPNIDCTRDTAGVPIPGRPGVLYVINSSTLPGTVPDAQLYAIIVDSAGIETRAVWPKALHDPRNTNNAGTDLSQFACP